MLNNHTDYFLTDDLPELRQLRMVSLTHTLVLGYVNYKELRETVSLRGILGVYDAQRLKLLESMDKKTKVKPRVHIKIACIKT